MLGIVLNLQMDYAPVKKSVFREHAQRNEAEKRLRAPLKKNEHPVFPPLCPFV